jgi:hypothetical protein
MYEAELQGVRIQKELAARRMSQIEQQTSGMEINASTAAIFEEMGRSNDPKIVKRVASLSEGLRLLNATRAGVTP